MPTIAKGEVWEEIGKLLDDSISAAPNIMASHKDKSWDGCRRCASLPREELVDVVTRFEYYKAVYDSQLRWRDKWVDKVESEIYERTQSAEAWGIKLEEIKDGVIGGLFGAVFVGAAGARAGLKWPGTLLGAGPGAIAGGIVGPAP